jgi:uncharacterized membrane protein YdjX (TVP38/TMEM64 family)
MKGVSPRTIMQPNDQGAKAGRGRGGRPWLKPLVFLVAAIAVAGLYIYFRDRLTLASLADDVERLRQWRDQHPIGVVLLLASVFVVLTGLSIPAVITMSIICGSLLGMWEGLIVASFSETAGAMLAFFSSRYLLRSTVETRWKKFVERADTMLDRDGVFYLLSLRLIHVIPSWLINLVIGCTRVRVATFWWTTQLGMLPATSLYVFTGARLPTMEQLKQQGVFGIVTPAILVVFVVLAVIPLVLRYVLRHRAT